MIYVDELRTYPPEMVAQAASKHGTTWCHLWCDSGEEKVLHEFAKDLGLKRSYFQGNRRLPHYDLTPSKRSLALRNGAKEMSLMKWFLLHRKNKTLTERT